MSIGVVCISLFILSAYTTLTGIETLRRSEVVVTRFGFMDPAVSAPDAVWPDEELVDFYGVPYKKLRVLRLVYPPGVLKLWQ